MRKFILLCLLAVAQLSVKSQDFKLTAILDQEVSCKGNKDGSIQASCLPEGNYKYVISRGKFTDSNPSGFFRNLVPGVYKVSATLDGKVFKSTKVTVTEPKALAVKFVVSSYPTLDSPSAGALSLEVSGGTADLQPYLVTWKNSKGEVINSDPNENFSTFEDNLVADTYSVTIEDDHGCFLTKSYKLKRK